MQINVGIFILREKTKCPDLTIEPETINMASISVCIYTNNRWINKLSTYTIYMIATLYLWNYSLSMASLDVYVIAHALK